MGVAIDRDALGPQCNHALEGPCEGCLGLPRQAIDQIEIDRPKARSPGLLGDARDERGWLYAIDGALHGGIEILHPDAHPIEAERAQQSDRFVAGSARIDLDREIAGRIVRKGKFASQCVHEPRQLGVAERGRGSASQMELPHLASAIEVLAPQRDLGMQGLRIGREGLLPPRDDAVAGAKKAG